MEQERQTREWYRRKIVEIINRIQRKEILEYIYIIVSDIENE